MKANRPRTSPPRRPRTYAERAAGGRPLVTFTLTTETKDLIVELADKLDVSRSALIALAVEAYAKRRLAAAKRAA